MTHWGEREVTHTGGRNLEGQRGERESLEGTDIKTMIEQGLFVPKPEFKADG